MTLLNKLSIIEKNHKPHLFQAKTRSIQRAFLTFLLKKYTICDFSQQHLAYPVASL